MSEAETTGGANIGPLDIGRVMAALPHRYPMLLVDRVESLELDRSIVAIKAVTFNEQFFQGHFPENPIFPGVLIIEGMAQTAGAIVIKHDSGTGKKNIVLMLGVDKAKFRKPAGPGDVIEFHIAKIQRRRNVGRYEAKAIVDGTVIAEAEITAMIEQGTQAGVFEEEEQDLVERVFWLGDQRVVALMTPRRTTMRCLLLPPLRARSSRRRRFLLRIRCRRRSAGWRNR